MYFEDIFFMVTPLWRKEFSLKGIEYTQTYFKDIGDNFNEIQNQYANLSKESLFDWKHIMIFSIYQALTQCGLDKSSNSNELILRFDDIPIAIFEKYFRKNLRYASTRKFHKKYKGFRNPPC